MCWDPSSSSVWLFASSWYAGHSGGIFLKQPVSQGQAENTEKIVSKLSPTTHPWLQKQREKKKKWKRVTAFSMLAIQLQLLESRLVHSCLQTCKPWPSSLSSPCKAQGERAGSSSLITLQTSARGHLWNDQTPLKPSAEARTLAYSQIVYLSVGHDLVKCDFETIISWKWTKSSQEGKKSP